MAITNSLHDLGNLTGNSTTAGADYKVSNLYKQAYSDAVRLQIQQFDSLLSDTLQRESIEGEVKAFDRLDKKSVDDLLTRTRSGLYGIKNGDVTADTVLAADAVYGASDTQRRMIEPQWFEYAELFDPRDAQGLMKAVRPDSQYLRNLAAIFNRKKDLIILDALSKAVLVQQRTGQGVTVNKTVGYTGDFTWTNGSIATGGDNGTVVNRDAYEGFEVGCKLSRKYSDAYPADSTAATVTGVLVSSGANNDTTPLLAVAAAPGATYTANDIQIAGVDFTAAATAGDYTSVGVTPFNIEKLIRARQKLESNNALMPGTRYICVLHPDQFYSLMADASDTRFTSIDFNDGKPLINGEAFKFMGFEFRLSNLVPQATFTAGTDAADTGADYQGPAGAYSIVQGGVPVRYAYFYTEQCGIFGMNADMSIRFDEIPERGYALQMWHQIGMNAIRMDGDCIVRVASVDEPA